MCDELLQVQMWIFGTRVLLYVREFELLRQRLLINKVHVTVVHRRIHALVPHQHLHLGPHFFHLLGPCGLFRDHNSLKFLLMRIDKHCLKIIISVPRFLSKHLNNHFFAHLLHIIPEFLQNFLPKGF